MMSIVPEEGSLTPSDAQAKSPTPSKIHNTVNNFHKTLFELHIFQNIAKVVTDISPTQITTLSKIGESRIVKTKKNNLGKLNMNQTSNFFFQCAG